jgi:CRP/FNR family cyclic AMP-dependent transcriptional regulator
VGQTLTGLPDLSGVELFEVLPEDERDHLARLMRPFSAAEGATLFAEGDPGDGLYVLTEGSLRVVRPGPHGMDVPLATIGPGAIVGELSMLGAGTRTATVAVAREASGWKLDRRAFEVLRADLRPGSVALIRRLGRLAAERMRTRYEAIAAQLGVTPAAGAFPGSLPEAAPERDELEHLATTLMFARMSPAALAEIVDDARRLFAARGAVVLAPGVPPPALYVVVRGAVEVAVRGPDTVQRVRLAGPGRAVGQLGVLGTHPAVAEARARERTVLLELPWPRVHALLDGATDAARAFVLAFSEDVVRALRYAESPVAALRVASGPADVPLQRVRALG